MTTATEDTPEHYQQFCEQARYVPYARRLGRGRYSIVTPSGQLLTADDTHDLYQLWLAAHDAGDQQQTCPN